MTEGTAEAASTVRVICGLGNPGPQYRGTRHNIGFEVVEALGAELGVSLRGDLCRARTAEARIEGPIERVVLAAPQTFMNRSGFAVRCLAERLEVPSDAILVVYDDVHLPLGRLRLRRKGSPGGHRGIESVLENLGTDEVPRLRLGVGAADGPTPGESLVDFVLGPFEPADEDAVSELVDQAVKACLVWARDGVEAAMRAHNG